MVMLVTLQQASDYLRRDTDDDDNALTLIIKAASRAVLDFIDDVDFLDSSGEVELDSNGNTLNVPEPLQLAVLAVTQIMYDDGTVQAYIEGDDSDRLGKISLPRMVHWLLEPYRTPRLA